MNIIGISSFYHDSAACLIVDGKISSAVQEERFTRIKHDSSFPISSIKYCLANANLCIEDIDYFVFYDKPYLKFSRLLETHFAFAPYGYKSYLASLPVWLKDKLFQKNAIELEISKLSTKKNIDFKSRILFSEHHLSHAASAFFPSPFENAAVLTMDGVGEWTTTSLSIGSGNNISICKEINFPHSLGLLYSAFTYYTGFKVNSGEYKLMGLAPYGNPIYVDHIRNHLIDIKDDGTFRLDMSYFDYCTGVTMTNDKFSKLFDGEVRSEESSLTQKHMDIAASIQKVTEEVVIKLARNIRKETNIPNLCLAGGVALNCVANGKLVREKIFDEIWIQPASGDAGGAIGAALSVYHLMLNKPRIPDAFDSMRGSYLGPTSSNCEIMAELDTLGAIYTELDDESLYEISAKALASGKSVGWHQGRMEFGPRALGGRSIIADPRSSTMQKQLNLKVKYRESFRPFAPSILEEDVSDWFEIGCKSPYMLLVANVADEHCIPMSEEEQGLFGIEKLNVSRSKIPAVTHVDYSARIQTVSERTNPRYYNLLKKFKEITGCPILVNTSFNVRGEPIVNTPTDSFNCFMGTDIDLLVIGNFVLKKEDQDPSLIRDYKSKYKLD